MIAVIDCDNFFVSCERLFRPDLRRQPVVVLSANDGCVVARSKEIKDKGIPMGVPYFQIKDMLSDINATTFSSNFPLYRDISRRVFYIIRSEFEYVEQYSIDESFISIDDDEESGLAHLAIIKDRIQQEVGIPISIAVGPSKTIAKYGLRTAKKTHQIVWITRDAWEKQLPYVYLRDIWGVARGYTKRFSDRGLVTAYDFCLQTPRSVAALFGAYGITVLKELQGYEGISLQTDRGIPKSVMHSRSFAREISTVDALLAVVFEQVIAVSKVLCNGNITASALRVFAYPSRFGDYAGGGFSIEVPLLVPTYDVVLMKGAVKEAVVAQYASDMPYKRAGVCAVGISPAVVTQGSLFYSEATSQQEVTHVIHELRQKYGTKAISFAHGTKAQQVPASNASYRSTTSTTTWKDIPLVHA